MSHTARLASLVLSIAISAAIGGNCFAGEKTKPYRANTCIVTDNDLDSMGDKQSFVHNGQKIMVCCEPCVGKFKKNPEKYLKKL